MTEQTAIYGPIVNINGADRRDLIKQYLDVAEAARNLLRALGAASPHGRDYQTAAYGVHSKDRALWQEAVRQVDNIERQWQAVVERLVTED
jgi:hypothetical protein